MLLFIKIDLDKAFDSEDQFNIKCREFAQACLKHSIDGIIIEGKDLMGKGKDIVTKATEFVKTGDTSVLGLLTQLNTAVQVLGNKLTDGEEGGILGGAQTFLSGLFGGGSQDKEEETKAATGEKGDVGEDQKEGEEKPDASGSFGQVADAIAKLNTPTPPAEAEGGEKKEKEKLPEKDNGGWISGHGATNKKP